MLKVTRNDTTVFESDGKWLHPLLELGDKIGEQGLAAEELYLHDSVIGRAAALLIVRLGIKTVFAGILSEPGKSVLETFGITFDYDTLVPRIACMTEELLQSVTSPEEAWRILKERAKK